MTTVAPVNQRGNATAVLVENLDDEGARMAPGTFSFYTVYGDKTESEAGILFGCPCGCGSLMGVGFDTHESQRPRWHWDGNRESPTLTPSILIYQLNDKAERIGEHWHGFLTAGEFRSC